MNREDAKSLLLEVKENHKKLMECKLPHDFSIDLDTNKEYSKRLQCTKCNAYIFEHNAMWYKRGLEDAKKRLD